MNYFTEHFFEPEQYILCTLNNDSIPPIPSSCHIQELGGHFDVNNLNIDCLPNNPAHFWIIRGYQVYSMIVEGHWLQIIQHPTNNIVEMESHKNEYSQTFEFYETSEEDQRIQSGCSSKGVLDDCDCGYCNFELDYE